jgi:hypothetical protein
MPWTFEAVGSPEKIAEALEARSRQFTDEGDREQYDGAKPYLQSLVKQHTDVEAPGAPVGVRIRASGSGSSGVEFRSDVSVIIERVSNYVG